MDIIKAADRYVGVPYRIHGRDLSGWDCWGCVRFARQELFGKVSPSWSEAYNALDFRNPEALESIIKAHMDGWREVSITPGAVILFRVMNRDAHVGLYLGKGLFLHTLYNCETAIVPLEDWNHRIVAVYDTE